jgi:hypothetical protein
MFKSTDFIRTGWRHAQAITSLSGSQKSKSFDIPPSTFKTPTFFKWDASIPYSSRPTHMRKPAETKTDVCLPQDCFWCTHHELGVT